VTETFKLLQKTNKEFPVPRGDETMAHWKFCSRLAKARSGLGVGRLHYLCGP